MTSRVCLSACAREAILEEVVRMVRAGLFIASACRLAGLSPRTLRHWRARPRDDSRTSLLLGELDRVEAQIEVDLLAEVLAAGDDWRGPAWLLERRFPTRWGKGRRRVQEDDRPERVRHRIVAAAEASGIARREAEPGRKQGATRR